MQIREVPFVVTDTETTGTRAGSDRLIEIAAVRVRGGRIVDRFSSLINPKRSVPSRITALTGISTGMVFGAPGAEEVLPAYLDFLGDGVLVAHNLPFDQRFLDAALARLGRPALTNATLCTLRLARRLLRGLRSKGLSSVADFYGIPIEGRHRALGDAEATAAILLRFLDQLAYEYELEALDDLLSYQKTTYVRKKTEPAHRRTLREKVLNRLPERPGVYFMKDRSDKILYIGKAKNLKNRVRSYFNAVEAHPPRIRSLIETVRTVHWEETTTELGALLLESRLIKEHQPAFNRAQRRYRNRPFIRLETDGPYPRVSWSAYLIDDGAEYFGPLGGRTQAEQVVDVINRYYLLRECDDDTFKRGVPCMYGAMGRCLGPCAGPVPAYAEEVERVRLFLTGQDRAVVERIRAEMQEAARAMDYEQAARYRDWYTQLDGLLSKQQCVASPVLDHHAVVLVRERNDPSIQALVVRYGRYVDTLDLSRPPAADEVARLRALLARHFEAGPQRPERYLRAEIDEVRLLAHWMYVHRNDTVKFDWHPGDDLDRLVGALCAEAARGG